MARVVIFSDLHSHPFKPYATILPNGMNSRLADAINCIKQIHEHAVALGADLVLFGGDMFHVRKTISVQAFNAVYQEMSKFAVDKIPVALIHGNHDQADKAGDQYSIYAFSSFLHVVDKPGWLLLNGADHKQTYAIMAVPYMEDVDHLKSITAEQCPYQDVHKIFLGHMGIQGAVVGSDFVYPGLYDPKIQDLRPEQFDAVYLGHFHKHQQLAKNAWYIGAPFQHNWGDREDSRGFLIYDTETKTHERILLKYPKFVQVTDKDVEESDTHGADLCEPDSFVRVLSHTAWSETQREEYRKHINARSLEIVPPKRDQAPVPNRLQVDPTVATSELLERYVHSGLINVDGLDENYLLQLGQELLQEVEEGQQ